MSAALREHNACLIIAGATKCATTSLHAWLAAHPEIIGGQFKETRFFLDADYPVTIPRNYPAGTSFADLFPAEASGVLLDATPDYLYSPGTPARLAAELPTARIVIVLRHPVQRLLSWYGFARQIGQLPTGLSFADYARAQLGGNGGEGQAWQALAQGRYASWLQRWYAVFPAEQILVLRYEDLIADPGQAVQTVCRFAGLESAGVSNIDFKPRNQTRQPRFARFSRAYRLAQAAIRSRVATMPRVRSSFRALHRALEPILFSSAADGKPQQEMDEELHVALQLYYANVSYDVMQIAGLASAPWPDLDQQRARPFASTSERRAPGS